MYITGKLVFYFLTYGINSLSSVCSLITRSSESKSLCTTFIPSHSSSVMYPFIFQLNNGCPLKNLCHLLVKPIKNPSLFFVSSSFTS